MYKAFKGVAAGIETSNRDRGASCEDSIIRIGGDCDGAITNWMHERERERERGTSSVAVLKYFDPVMNFDYQACTSPLHIAQFTNRK